MAPTMIRHGATTTTPHQVTTFVVAGSCLPSPARARAGRSQHHTWEPVMVEQRSDHARFGPVQRDSPADLEPVNEGGGEPLSPTKSNLGCHDPSRDPVRFGTTPACSMCRLVRGHAWRGSFTCTRTCGERALVSSPRWR